MNRSAASHAADGPTFADTASRGAKSSGSAVRLLRRIAREPFVHFTLLGALVFAGHRLLAPALEVPTIKVSLAKQRELDELFEHRQRRAPDAAERAHLIRRYVVDEALFREALRLSLAQTDPVLRAQLIARMRGMLQAELDQAPPTEAELTGYYQAHRSKYVRVDGLGAASEPSLESIRERVSADYRKDRTSRSFQVEVDHLTSQWRVQIAESP